MLCVRCCRSDQQRSSPLDGPRRGWMADLAQHEPPTGLWRVSFAGFPPTTAFAGTSLVTIAPAPITALSPIDLTEGITIERTPTHAFLPMTIGAGAGSERGSSP